MVSTPGFRPVQFGNKDAKSRKAHMAESLSATPSSSVESDKPVKGESPKSKHEADDQPVTKFFKQVLGAASDFFQKIADFFQELATQFKDIDLEKVEASSLDEASDRPDKGTPEKPVGKAKKTADK
jgi:hypothetical protein